MLILIKFFLSFCRYCFFCKYFLVFKFYIILIGRWVGDLEGCKGNYSFVFIKSCDVILGDWGGIFVKI